MKTRVCLKNYVMIEGPGVKDKKKPRYKSRKMVLNQAQDQTKIKTVETF